LRERIHHAGHGVHGVAAEFRARAVGGFAARFELQPDVAFVRGDDLVAGRLADDGEIRLQPAFGERAGTGLGVFFIHQSGEDDFGLLRALAGFRNPAQRREHGRDGAFGVAGAAAEQPIAFTARDELVFVHGRDGVQVRREQNGLGDPALWPEPGEEIDAARQHFLEFDFQAGARGGDGDKIGHTRFAGAGVPGGQKGRINAGQRDQFGEQF
jgi:hypothetical protein